MRFFLCLPTYHLSQCEPRVLYSGNLSWDEALVYLLQIYLDNSLFLILHSTVTLQIFIPLSSKVDWYKSFNSTFRNQDIHLSKTVVKYCIFKPILLWKEAVSPSQWKCLVFVVEKREMTGALQFSLVLLQTRLVHSRSSPFLQAFSSGGIYEKRHGFGKIEYELVRSNS